jgi:hypothetical protein
VRAVRGRRLPGARVPFVKRTLVLLDTNRLSSPTFATPVHVYLHVDPSQLYDSDGRHLLRSPYITLSLNGGHLGRRYQARGYAFELQVFQGGRRIARARGRADRCDPRFDCTLRSLTVSS